MANTRQTQNPPPADEHWCGITALGQRLTESLKPFAEELQELIERLEGISLGRDANKATVEALLVLLQRLGLRVECPVCHQPAILRCRFTRTARSGSFQFEHFRNGRQTNHGGGTTFPKLRLVPAPADRRKKPASAEG